MSPAKQPTDLAASVRARLLNLARQRGVAAPERQVQWRAFLRRGRLPGPPDAGVLVDALRAFLWPVLEACARGDAFVMRWPPGGPWQGAAS